MKHKLIFRIFAVAISLSLMLVALPVSPALAAMSVTVDPDEGTVGDDILVEGSGYPQLQEVDIYFSSQEAEVDDELDTEVTVYEWLTSVTAHQFTGDFNTMGMEVPPSLTDGDDAPEAVHDGRYYFYVTYFNQDRIRAVTTFTVVGIAEIVLDTVEGTVGTEVEISGTGFAADEVVSIEYDGDVLDIESGDDVTDSDGEFILSVIVPESVSGDHTITAIGQDSLAELEAVFAVEPAITISPEEGPSDTFVTVTGTGFARNGDVVIYFDGAQVKTKRAGTNGSFDTFFAVPDEVQGSYDVLAEDDDDAAIWAVAEFTVIVIADPTITVSPTSGVVDDEVIVSGSDFSANKNIYLYFDGDIIGTSATGANGDFTDTLTIPASSPGTYTIKAEDADGNFAEAEFIVTIIVNPAITVSPTNGFAGDEVTVSGTDFSADKNIYLYFDGDIVGTGVTGPNGDFTDSLTIPPSSQGAYTIKAEDADGNFAEAAFTINANPEITITPTSGIVGDTVSVSGTDFAASSSVTITFDGTSIGTSSTNASGNFSIAAITIPASASGAHTIKAEDGDGNFATATFTTLPEITMTSISGIVGDTVTISGSGFAASSSVTITFNTASIGTAATNAGGSFSGAVITIPASAGGAHAIKAEDGAGNFVSETFTTLPAMSITPASGIIGETVTVSGSGFAASSSVTITFDGTSVGTATTNASGNFSAAAITIPASANGAHAIKAEDGAGNFATATFNTGEEMSITPASGFVADEITVSGSGFGGNKSIDIYLDDVLISVGVATADANGDFTATFTIPASSGGAHAVKALDSDGNSTMATLTVKHKMTITPTTGVSATEVTVTGTGFSATKLITITYNGEVVATSPTAILTDSSGSFNGRFDLPEAPAGTHIVEVSDGTSSDSASFVAGYEVDISATSGSVGDEVVISGTGFRANTTLTVTYEADPDEVGTGTTDSNGSFSVAVTIPSSAGGAHTITATDGDTTRQFTFVMEQQAPQTPQPLLPLGGGNPEQPVSFDWADVTDPSLPLVYTLQIARDEDFTDVVLERTGLTESEYTMTEEEKLESTKKENPYYWRVQAVDGASNESGWTGAGSFDIGGSSWPAIPAWVRWLLLGLGIVVVIVVGFWLGMRTAYSSF